MPESMVDPERLADIAAELGERGWVVVRDFIPPAKVAALREEALAYWNEGEFRPAGVGRGESFGIRPEIRNDRVLWLDSGKLTPLQADYFATLEGYRQAINRQLFLGLFDFEGHLALYPPGAFYRRHLDQFKGIGLRTVTAILYLNDHWQPEDGGLLRLYTDGEDDSRYVDIPPEGGTFVTFLSSEYLHEVLPSRRDRLALTGWFRRREV